MGIVPTHGVLLPGLAALLPESGCCGRAVAKIGALLPCCCQIGGFVAGILPKGVFSCRPHPKPALRRSAYAAALGEGLLNHDDTSDTKREDILSHQECLYNAGG